MPIHIAADKEFECEEAVRVLLAAYPRGVKEPANVGELPETGAVAGTGGGTDAASGAHGAASGVMGAARFAEAGAEPSCRCRARARRR